MMEITRQEMLLENNKKYILSERLKREIDHWVEKFPVDQKQSALIPSLLLVQRQTGWLPTSVLDAVADYLTIDKIHVYGVAAFYTMLHLKPTGRHVISVCTNVSCMLSGCSKIEHHLQKKLNIGFHETTADGKFTLEEVECLGACVGAPAVQIGERFYENVTPEKIDQILSELD